ncbi:hypothetical protein ACIQGO_24085 [Streptomyces shenzhenensis]|uniref:hypothetical protein n=1 Tax=Streptomyces shenzhenensis TaxID=943815 RepID=UPI0038199B89
MTDDTLARPARAGRGRPSAMPSGAYEPEPVAETAARTLLVPFHGEDGRTKTFDFRKLPLPTLSAEFAVAFAARTGAAGGLRTLNSANGSFTMGRRFLVFLESLRNPPHEVAELTTRHLERYRFHRMESLSELGAERELMEIRALLRQMQADMLSPGLRDHLTQYRHGTGLWKRQRRDGVSGYSDREFRDLMTAARSDVVAIRDRIDAAESLLNAYRTDSDALSAAERERGAVLDAMDRTGIVPRVHPDPGSGNWDHAAETQLAGQLFLTIADLPPLIVLAIGLSGRNVETIKELGAEHQVLDDRAIRVHLTKRRRDKQNVHSTVVWEIGTSQSRQLHTPGGFYLLLHRLTARGRRFSGDTRVWSIWRGAGARSGSLWEKTAAAHGHRDPFAVSLKGGYELKEWARRHGLTADETDPNTGERLPLPVNGNRIKTTVEVRTVKAVGGHLPSASRTNTIDVSFEHYLRGDKTVRDWAEKVLGAALSDAESSARAFHLRVLNGEMEWAAAQTPETVATALGTTAAALKSATAGELDTLASSCLDIEHHPDTDAQCNVSFLTCLSCSNALVAERHLPALLALLDMLQNALQELPVDAWVARHGRTWLTITRLILPRFTDGQVEKAARNKPSLPPLDLLDGPKEPQ